MHSGINDGSAYKKLLDSSVPASYDLNYNTGFCCWLVLSLLSSASNRHGSRTADYPRECDNGTSTCGPSGSSPAIGAYCGEAPSLVLEIFLKARTAVLLVQCIYLHWHCCCALETLCCWHLTAPRSQPASSMVASPV